MSMTAQEVLVHRIARQSASDVYGILEDNNSFKEWMILKNQNMIFKIISDTVLTNAVFTSQQLTNLQGKLILQS